LNVKISSLQKQEKQLIGQVVRQFFRLKQASTLALRESQAWTLAAYLFFVQLHNDSHLLVAPFFVCKNIKYYLSERIKNIFIGSFFVYKCIECKYIKDN